jgi:hypothetical protein
MKKLIIALTILVSSSIANANTNFEKHDIAKGVLDLVEKGIPVPIDVSCENTLKSKGFTLKKYGQDAWGPEVRILEQAFNMYGFFAQDLYYEQRNETYDYAELMVPVYFKGNNMIVCVNTPGPNKNIEYLMFVMTKTDFDNFVIDTIKNTQSGANAKESDRKQMFDDMSNALDSLN